jgi:cytochrome oxidase Cu insertion factor (SCO1/SenC/PrrC family)
VIDRTVRPRLLLRGGVVLAACAMLLSGCGGSSPAAPRPPARSVGTRLDAAVPKSILSLPFKDSQGHVRHLSDFAGKLLVLSDSMTLCQESCPLDTAGVVQTAREVARAGDARHTEFLTVTVDPWRDTPRRLAAYRKLFRPAPANWLMLTGTPANVHLLWKAFGVYVKRVNDGSPAPRDWLTGKPLRYDLEHSDEVFFLDGRARERFILDGLPHLAGPKAIPHTLYQFMTSKGHHNLTHPGGTAWTPSQALAVLGWLQGRRMVAA